MSYNWLVTSNWYTGGYQLKDQLLRTTVDNIDRKVEKIDMRLEKMEERLIAAKAAHASLLKFNSKPKRLTFDGSYNAKASYLPSNEGIVFFYFEDCY